MLRGFSAVVSLVLLLSTFLSGQQIDTATVIGTVTDTTGGAIAMASIQVRHLGTGGTRHVETNGEGFYRTPPLRVGKYVIDVDAQGFKHVTRQGVILNVGDVRVVDIAMELGAALFTVDVTAPASPLQTSDATAGTVIDNRQIVNLPLNGRDYLQLALISSGTAPPIRSEFRAAQGFSVGGHRPTQVNFLIDGIDNNNQSIASQGNQKEAIKPSIDAIQEFKVLVNNYSAEYGRTAGGVVNLTIKSGSNELHGAVYEFLHNETVDAKNFFDPTDQEKPPFRRHQYGFALGGPIRKDKAFLFGDLEFTDIRESATIVSTVPNLAEKAGDFSAGSTIIYDPLTYDLTANARQPFPNNLLPESRTDSVSAQIRAWWPAPQNSSTTNNYVHNPPRVQDQRRWDIRYDQNLSPGDNFYLRWSSQQQTQLAVPNFPDTPLGSLSGALSRNNRNNDVTSNNVALVYNRTWRPTVTTSIRAGWNHIDTDVTAPIDEDVNSIIGLSGVDQTLPGAALIEVSGFRSVGSRNFNPNLIQSQTRQLSVDTTWTRGPHTMKFGGSVYWLQSFITNPQRAKGWFRFDGRFSDNPAFREDRLTDAGGSPLADFLLGASFDASGSNFVYMNVRSPFVHGYFQEDWRVTKQLTLNLGVRYEVNPPWVETRDLISNFDIDTDPDNPRIVVAGEEGTARFDRAFQTTDYTNLAPRLGFAYQLRASTVLRGGYGIFYANVMNTGGGEFLETNPPFHIKVNLTTDSINPTLELEDGLPAGVVSPLNACCLTLSSFERQVQWPLAQHWNLNVQRELAGNILWEAGYFGSKGNHLIRRYNGNFARPGPGSIDSRRRYQAVRYPGTDLTVGPLSSLFRFQYDGNMIYHGLQTKLEKRYVTGLTFIGSYTWSKTITDVGGECGSSRCNAIGETWLVQDALNFKPERSLASHHLTHRLVFSGIYDLPLGRGHRAGAQWSSLNALLGGWTVGGIATLLSGSPMNLRVQGNPSNTGDADRPDVVGEWKLPRRRRTLDQWFNTDAFVRNQPFQFGNAGRNVLIGPGVVKFDLTAHKTFPINERLHAELRFEAFNAFNTPIFDGPNTQLGNRNFGVISNVATPRNWQLGLKLLF